MLKGGGLEHGHWSKLSAPVGQTRTMVEKPGVN